MSCRVYGCLRYVQIHIDYKGTNYATFLPLKGDESNADAFVYTYAKVIYLRSCRSTGEKNAVIKSLAV